VAKAHVYICSWDQMMGTRHSCR